LRLPFAPGPNLAFVLTIFGILLVYCELIWMGRIVPGVAGALAVICGIYWLWQLQPGALGLELLAAAIACFALEACFRNYFVAGMAGTALLGCGFWKLFNQPPWIVAGLAFPMSALLGAVTTVLLEIARRARRNKRNLSR
jgi:membrane-bound serine protease (ClpP class)